MDGIHDLGGMHGFGRVEYDPAAPAFHHDWERRVFAAFVATLGQGLYNMDEVRHSIERMDPARYLSTPYYGKWLSGIERLLVEKGVLNPTRIVKQAKAFERGEGTVPERTDPDLVSALRAGMVEAYAAGQPPRDSKFAPGDAVSVRKMHPSGHTRVPRYVRGKTGVVRAEQGTFSLPDATAHGDEDAAPVYNVSFDPQTLWGDDGEGAELRIDLWEPYLEPPVNRDGSKDGSTRHVVDEQNGTIGDDDD